MQNSTYRLNQLELRYSLLSNFKQLIHFQVTSHVMHSQKIANLSDLIMALMDLLQLMLKHLNQLQKNQIVTLLHLRKKQTCFPTFNCIFFIFVIILRQADLFIDSGL